MPVQGIDGEPGPQGAQGPSGESVSHTYLKRVLVSLRVVAFYMWHCLSKNDGKNVSAFNTAAVTDKKVIIKCLQKMYGEKRYSVLVI